jgi:hypothetical protein
MIFLVQGLYLFIKKELTCGFIFGYFSQISHISLEMEWRNVKLIDTDWGKLQIETARDYCTDSYFWTYFSGYLNFQVSFLD